jgi:hypothetical protein
MIHFMRHSGKFWVINGLVLAVFAGLGLRAVEEPQNDFRFAVIGDRTGGAQPQIYGRVWREVALLHPEFVLNVGDTIQGGDDETALEQWKELRPIWSRYQHFPLYFTVGNHDVWSELSKELYEQETGRRTHYSFDYQDTHFTVLDTAGQRDDPDRGRLSRAQFEFLEQDLEANRDKSPKIVLFHHPFWIAEMEAEDGEFPLHELAKKYGVSNIISGHGHKFVRRVRDGIAYMEVGSSGGQMTGGLVRGEGFKDGRFYHWVSGYVKRGKVSFTVKELGGAMGQGRMFEAEDWGENGPKFDVGDPALTYQPET